MTSRTLKLLTASTAFVAAASVGQAADISTSLTATQFTSETGAFNIITGGSIVTDVSSAIVISSTSAASNTITISTGTSVTSSNSATNPVISSSNVNNGAVTINVSGTVSALSGTTKAIDLSGMTNGNTIRNDGTISGSVTLGNGTNTFSSNGGTTNGAITGGTGGDTVTLTNATVNGNMAGGSGTDILNINGTQTFTTGGTIGAFETINFNTNTNINNTVTGATSSVIADDKTVTVNAAANLGAVTNSGTLTIGAGSEVNALTYTSTGTLGINVGSSNTTDVGQLILSGGDLATGTSVTINMVSSAGYIASGTQYIIATGTGTQGVASLTTAATGVYRFSTAVSNTNDLALTVGRVSTSSVVTGETNQTVANILDNLGAGATGQLATVQGVIGSQSTATGVQNVLESLTPSIDGAGVASVNFAVDAGNQISNRLASVRGNGYGVATGDAMAANHMWAQGFGSTVTQDDKDGARGYDADSAGASIGMDTDTLIDGVTTGVAVTYGNSTVDSNASGGASTDIDTYAATLYGSRVLDNGIFVSGQAGVGYNKYDMERTISGVGTTKGDTDGLQGTAKVETGRDFAFGGATLTPLASLQYTYLDMDSYTETGAGGASLNVDPDAMSTVDAGIGGEASYAIALSDGGTLKPSVRAKYVYRMGDDSMATTSQFIGGGAAFNSNGVEGDKSSVNLGAGLLLTTVAGTDLSLNYDADIRSNLTGHTGQVKARWAF
jgi:outer membrane autotransporter protein